jgi:hypothetical protein
VASGRSEDRDYGKERFLVAALLGMTGVVGASGTRMGGRRDHVVREEKRAQTEVCATKGGIAFPPGQSAIRKDQGWTL